MKQFSCGDVVAGCGEVFTAPTDKDILRLVAAHAVHDHGLTSIPADLVEAVNANIRIVAA